MVTILTEYNYQHKTVCQHSIQLLTRPVQACSLKFNLQKTKNNLKVHQQGKDPVNGTLFVEWNMVDHDGGGLLNTVAAASGPHVAIQIKSCEN